MNSDITNTENQTCPATGFQSVSVCVPVTVAPFAQPGTTITECVGDPVISSGKATCPGAKNGVCTFTISQKLCVEVPVLFGANASVGDVFVNCLGISEKPCDEESGQGNGDQ